MRFGFEACDSNRRTAQNEIARSTNERPGNGRPGIPVAGARLAVGTHTRAKWLR